MKKIITFTLILVSFWNISKADILYKTDTIIIEFGNNSRLVIYVDNDEDLKDLESYDINAMIAELNMNIAESNDAEYLQITDESGTRFLKDTTVSLRDSSVKYYADEDLDDDVSSRIRAENNNTNIEGSDQEYIWKSRRKERNPRTRTSFEMDLGINNWLENGKFPDESNQNYAVRPMGSWYVAFKNIHKTPLGGALFINWGGGISWYNWKFENNDVFIVKNQDAVDFIIDPTLDGKKSKLAATYLNVEVVPMLDFSYRRSKGDNNENIKFARYRKRGIRIGLGGYAGYRLASWSKFVFEENGDSDTNKEKSNYFLNNIRYGIRAQFGYKGMDFFANYDLNEVFASKENNPKLNAISFGVTF